MSTAKTDFKSNFLRTLNERGYIHQCTDYDALDAAMAEGEQSGKPVAAYIGFDCTATSLHVGGLMQIMVLRWLQKTGHKPVVLMGGGTTRIGDPSFKDSARPILTDEVIAENMAGIKKVFDKYMSFGEKPTDAIMVNNADWLDKLNYIDFLRDYGRLFSVNRMLSMDSVKLRLEREQHLSFLEFNYMIMQAYDFVELNKRHGVRLQVGGSDQWGNIINGVELGRKVKIASITMTAQEKIIAQGKTGILQSGLNSDLNVLLEPKDEWDDSDHENFDQAAGLDNLFGLTTPLLTTSSGAKMGKTMSGAVWLNDDMLSAYEFWQYWRNTEDADVVRFLKLYTELSMEQIAEMAAWEGAQLNEAKKILATEVTALCHGREAAEAAAETARQTFEQGGAGAALPEITLPENDLREGIAAFELFFQAGLAASKGDARRLIRGGGAKVNDVTIADENAIIVLDGDGDSLKLSAGKKHHKRVIAA